MPRHFWAFEDGDAFTGQPNTLRLDGPIAEKSWFGDEVTPEQFRSELAAHPGDLMVYINSPGGDVVAGSMIYAMLREHSGRVTVRIDGIAASAASVVAMAGDVVEMAPTAYMMIHNAATVAMGDNRQMRKAAEMLDEINRGIRTAYAMKTGKSERELARMMDDETWMSAPKALEYGFCDAISYTDSGEAQPAQEAASAAAAAATVADAAGASSTTAQAGSVPGYVIASSPARVMTRRREIMPAVAFSARAQAVMTTEAAARSVKPEPQKETEGEAAIRARLRLLSM